MVEAQQEAFAAVKESEFEEVFVHERGERAEDDVDEAETAVSLRDGDFGAKGRVAVHVIKIAGKRGIGMVQQGLAETTRRPAVDPHSLVNEALFESALSATKQPQLAVRPEAAVTNPAAKEEILAGESEPCDILAFLARGIEAPAQAVVAHLPRFGVVARRHAIFSP